MCAVLSVSPSTNTENIDLLYPPPDVTVRVLIESDVPRKRTSKPAALLMKVMPSIVSL